MTEATVAHPFSQEAFEAFLAARTEPDWLTQLRREAWEDFQQMDWPGRRDEEWIRTDIRRFKLDSFTMPSKDAEVADSEALLAEGVELGGWSAPGCRFDLDDKWSAKGVVFGSLDELVNDHGELIQKYLLNRAVHSKLDRFAALHAACWHGGHFLYVPKGVVVDQPLHALSTMTDGGVDMGHILVILEEGAEATVLSESQSVNEQAGGMHCGAIELFVAPGAHLRFVNLQNWGNKVWHFAHQKGIVSKDASLQWTIAAMGSRLAKVNQHVALDGEGATSQVNGVMFTEGKQHLSYHTLQHHEAAHCRSDFLYKAALQDTSRTVWRGMIKVDKDAQKTDGYQRNDNLLLSNTARADSIPGLEIEADDVRCTHGSTSGRVDDELIFYAQNRGFTRHEAIRMIVTGFFQQVFDRITIESVREALGLAIARRVRDYE
ncbi:MAG: Fe-S cluster assembly protein SufD [Planctomycetota bacterium]